MKLADYEFQSEFVRTHFNKARQEGLVEGRAGLIIRLLTLRFGPLADDARVRISHMSVDELDALGERLLTAPDLQHALPSQ